MKQQNIKYILDKGDQKIDFHVATIRGIYLNLLQLIIIVMTFAIPTFSPVSSYNRFVMLHQFFEITMIKNVEEN